MKTDSLLTYGIHPEVEAFSTLRDASLPYPVIQAHQTHGTRVAVIDRPGYTREELEGIDALVTDLKDCAIGVRTADCIPILMYDPVRKAAAAVHSGWRGTVEKICSNTIDAMYEIYGTDPGDIIAVIGPGIGEDSFQVGEEVALAFKNAGFDMERIWSFRGKTEEGSISGGHHINLWEAMKLTLVEAGVREENISTAGICTYERNDLFFSARREGKDCGRIINSIKIL